MRRRALAFLFVLYVAADFSNPMMPGAVSFDPDDSVDAIRAERSRIHEPTIVPPPAPAAGRPSVESEPAPVLRIPAGIPPVFRPVAPLPAHVAAQESPPPADDD